MSDQSMGEHFRTLVWVALTLYYFSWLATIMSAVPRRNGRKAMLPDGSLYRILAIVFMVTSSNGNIFRVTGPLCGEFTGHQWIPRTKASAAELWCLLWSAPHKKLSEQSWGWWSETPSRPLSRHCNVFIHRNLVISLLCSSKCLMRISHNSPERAPNIVLHWIALQPEST